MATGDNWCSEIDDYVPINQLAIPSTHDSSAYTKHSSWPGIKGTWAQRQSITEQLDSGVRALDLRVGISMAAVSARFTDEYGGVDREIDHDIAMYHGPVNLSIMLNDVLGEIRRWLAKNSDEFVLLIFQQQGKRYKGSLPADIDISDDVQDLVIRAFQEKLFLPRADLPDWPTVRKLRGKVLCLGRLQSDVACFHNVRDWLSTGDNTLGSEIKVTGTGLTLYLQDRYKEVTDTPLSISTRLGFGKTQDFTLMNSAKMAIFKRAAEKATKSGQLIVNHLSHSSLWYQPWQLGNALNQELMKDVAAKYSGLIMLDDVDAQTAKYIYNMNF